MAARAIARYVRVPPRKARLVADLVRGKNTNEVASLLKFTPLKAAALIGKVVKSAVANATSTGNVDPENLFVEEIQVNPGPIMKRFSPRAMGRATPIFKRTSHITVVLGER